MPRPTFKFELTGLNPTQRLAVETITGPILVLAGAGTGKTRVITCRVAWMIEQGIDPDKILAVTFTNKAAREMKERIGKMIPAGAAERVLACTFHSFGARLLRRHISRLGYSANFDIASDAYTDGLIRSLLGELSLQVKSPEIKPRQWQHLIGRAKSSLIDPGAVAAEPENWPLGFARLYTAYSERMKTMNMLDFDDLLVLVISLWKQFPEVLAACREQYQYLLVDEYQDTNHAQFILTSMLAGPVANLCVVGDDDQSIYGWRGAAVDNILDFKNRFPGTRVVRLEQNYRSTNTILEAANQVISRNSSRHGKVLWSQQGEGDRIMIVKAVDEAAEARFVADLIRERRSVRNRAWSDFAVLYRSNHLSRSLETALRKAAIDYCLVGGKSFYHRKEVLDAISFLRLADNPLDDQSLLRIINVPPRGIGEKAVGHLVETGKITGLPLSSLLGRADFLRGLPPQAARASADFHACLVGFQKLFKQPGDLARKIQQYLKEIGYLDGLTRLYKPRADALRRRDNLLELISDAAEFADSRGRKLSLGQFLERFALLDDNDRVEGRPEQAVSLMTVHGAKGLEFPVVIVVGMEHEFFPHRNCVGPAAVEEERRLFYVAATRAREELYLTHVEKRRIGGFRQRRRISRFAREIPSRYTLETNVDEALKPASAEVAADYLAKMKNMFSKPENQ